MIDDCVCHLVRSNLGYWNNFFISGVGSEAFRMSMLYEAYHAATTEYDKEHVTPWMQRYQTWEISLTIDHPDDLECIEKLIGDRDPVTVDYRELIDETVR